MSRTAVAIVLVILGFALQGVSFLAFGASLGNPTSPDFSDPRVPFASLIFIVGILFVFLAFIVYELMPERKERE